MKFYSTGQLARKFKVTNTTIRRWIESGKFENIEKKTLGGTYCLGRYGGR